jgi:hypothetical protein
MDGPFRCGWPGICPRRRRDDRFLVQHRVRRTLNRGPSGGEPVPANFKEPVWQLGINKIARVLPSVYRCFLRACHSSAVISQISAGKRPET